MFIENNIFSKTFDISKSGGENRSFAARPVLAIELCLKGKIVQVVSQHRVGLLNGIAQNYK